MPIVIDFLANVRDFLRGTSDAEEAFEQVADSLDDAARDGERATERLEGSFRELSDAVKRETRDASRAMETNIDHGATRARATMQEVKQEALQNASETFSSFDGTARSFVDGIQGTFGGLVAGLASVSPALVPVGVAGAIAIGLITAELTNQEERAQAVRDRAAELAQAFIDGGHAAQPALQDITDRLTEMVLSTESGNSNIADLRETATRAGISGERAFRDLTQALAGAEGQADALLEIYRDQVAQLEILNNTETDLQGNSLQRYTTQIDGLNQIIGLLESEASAQQRAADIEAAANEVGIPALQLRAGLIAQIDSAYDAAAGSVADYISEETGVLDTAAYIQAMTEREEALRRYQAALASSELSNEAKAFLNEQGAEMAAAMLAGYQSADAATRAQLDRIWTEAGKQNSGSYSTAIESAFQQTEIAPPAIAWDPAADGAAYRSEIQRYFQQNPVRIVVQGVVRTGSPVP